MIKLIFRACLSIALPFLQVTVLATASPTIPNRMDGSHPVAHESFSIWTPRAHNPAFVQAGDSMLIEIMADSSWRESGWSATVKNDFATWPCQVLSAKWDAIHHQTSKGWVLTIQLPGDVPPELVGLAVSHASGKTALAERAVHVVPDLEADFYILHQSDQHLTQDSAGEPGGTAGERWSGGTKEALNWLAPVVNLINPRLVFQTGDNMQLYNRADEWCGMEEAKVRVARFMEGLAGFEVPTVLATGNHDLGWGDYVDIKAWRKQYTEQVGQRAFSFRMGSMYVLNTEWTSNEFLDWARADYARSWNDPTVKYRLLVSHFYDGLEGWTNIATAAYPSDLLLVGHNHRTRVLQTEPFTVLSVGSAQDFQRAAFFNFRRTASGWTSEQPAMHADGITVHRMLGDYGKPTVSASYERENDGTASANSVWIANDLPHDFYDGRVRFVMKKGRYQVTGGNVLAQYDTDDGEKTVVLVKVNIRQNAKTQVMID
ncbi:metallophosphoesterase family protein [Parapedobacter sp. GCM10030251]|uniref:metallophosphoesterase family protein n=1 Tax=Parapedobacter sp. GCM10030251 TaxID=3273419 RepID=UPI00361A51BE